MKLTLPLRILLAGFLVLCVYSASANENFEGRWRLNPDISSALDGWHKMDLVVGVEGSKVALTHEMQWRQTKLRATNELDTARRVELDDFFRIEQRHMAVYAAEDGATLAEARWIDDGRTLLLQAETPLEVSQGVVSMRIYSEYRLSELGDKLTLIELHSTRNRPLIYVFNKVNEQVSQ